MWLKKIYQYFHPRKNLDFHDKGIANIIISICLVAIITNIVIGVFDFFSPTYHLEYNYSIIILLWTGMLLFYKYKGWNVLIGNIICLLIFVGTVPVILNDGGRFSYNFPWLATLPLLAFVVCGKLSGFAWTSIVFIFLCLLFNNNLDSFIDKNTIVVNDTYIFITTLGFTLVFSTLLFSFRLFYDAVIFKLIKQNKNSRALSQKLQLRNKELESFAYTIAHDLKQPLRTISSFSRLLKMSNSLEEYMTEDDKTYLNSINNSAQEMDSMIEVILTFSHINKHFEDLNQKIDLNKVIIKSKKNLQLLLLEHKINLSICDKLPTVLGNESIFIILFQNIIHNAIKYRKKDEQTQINIDCELYKDQHQIKISDNGIGIQKNKLDEIFSSFYQTKNGKDFDIKLATCKKIVENINGTIHVESEITKGTRFIITIPKI